MKIARLKLLASLLLLSAMICSCSNSELSASEYLEFYKKNSDKFQRINQQEYLIGILHNRPTELIVAQEIENGILKTNQEISERIKTLSEEIHFLLTIQTINNVVDPIYADNPEPHEVQQRIHSLSYEMNQYLIMECGDHPIRTSNFHFERVYRVKNENRFILSFPLCETLQENIVIYFRTDIYRQGLLRFEFDQKILSMHPRLKH